MARLDLARLVEQRARLARLGRRIGGVSGAGSDGYVYSLDAAGQRLFTRSRGRYRAPWTPQPNHLRHGIAVSDLYAELRRSERPQSPSLAAFDAEPKCLAVLRSGLEGAQVYSEARRLHRYRSRRLRGTGFFVEVDCATESLPRITEKAKVYVRHWQSVVSRQETNVYPLGFLWITQHQALGGIVAALSRIPCRALASCSPKKK